MPEDVLLVLPTIITLATAAATLLMLRTDRLQRVVSLCSMGLLLSTGLLLLRQVTRDGILVTQIGGWPAPFGITLVADHLTAILIVIVGVVGLSASLYAFGDIDLQRVQFGFYPLLHILMAGVCGAFLAGDIFNLYVWFEVSLIASFILTALGNKNSQLEGAMKYTFVNLVASIFLLSAIGLLYGIFGTLNMADLARKIHTVDAPGLVTTIAVLFMVAFGLKAAALPFFFWLPASYPTPPVTVSATFVGLLTKVGVYALIRLFTLIFTQHVDYTHSLLLWMAGLTMMAGVLGAIIQDEFRRILSFHHISQIGYLIMGLALFTPLGLLGAIFFMMHYIIIKTNLFYISGLANRLTGTFRLDEMNGLYQNHPALAGLFLISALSLAGLPPLSGFWAKIILAEAGFAISEYAVIAVALIVSVLTLFSMTKIWNKAFLHPSEGAAAENPAETVASITAPSIRILVVPTVLLTLITLTISFYTPPFYDLAAQAADELMHPKFYIQAVFGS